jgi:hypothetical protein
LAERDAKDVRSHRPFRRRRDPQNVILISKDSSLASVLEAMIAGPRALRILSSSSQFPEPTEFVADTVVLDLPLRLRWAAFQQVRERYSGRLIVTVSSERETAGWLPDPACWFLVRPFGTEEVMRALRAPVPPGPAARPPLATRRRPTAGRAAAPPRPAAAPAPRPAEAAPQPARVARLSSEESLWEVDSGAATPSGAPAPTAAPVGQIPLAGAGEPEVARPVGLVPAVASPPAEPDDQDVAPSPRGRLALKAARGRLRRPSRRVLAEVVGGLVLLVVAGLGGAAIGRAGGSPDRVDVSATRPALTPSVTSRASSPTDSRKLLASMASCLSALDDADAAISYLVGDIRDERLSQAIQHYQADRRACREGVR